MKEPPKGWPRISPALFYQDAGAAIDWLCKAFGFEVRLKVEGEGGRIEHSELVFGNGLIMVGTAEKPADQMQMKSPRSLDSANTQSLFMYVDNVDAFCARALAEGAAILRPLETHDYGEGYWADRGFSCSDPEGHIWSFAQRVKDSQSNAE